MNAGQFLSEMLAWRQMVGGKPDLVAAIEDVWDRWLRWQRSQPPDVSKPPLVVLADLSCAEDLCVHIGVAQLLAHRRIRCAVVLSFPSKSLARIVRGQARREAWHGLVQIVDPSERQQLLRYLPADTPLAVFPAPAILSQQCLETMFATRHYWRLLPHQNREGEDDITFLFGSGFFGRAGDYSGGDEWGHPSKEASARGALQLLECASAELGLCPPPRVRVLRNHWPKGDSSIQPENSQQDVVDLSLVEVGDELIIRTNRDPLPSEVIERRFARLCASDEPLKIRLTGSMLSTAPRIARLESYKVNGMVAATNLLVRVPPSQLQPWMVSAFLNRGGGGNPVVRAFAEGIGCRLAYAEDEPQTLSEIPVVWGVLRESDRVLAQARAQSMHFFYIDHAYFNRGHGKSYRITRNRYEAGPIRKCPPDRLGQLEVEVLLWRKSGKEIIVCPPTAYFIEAHDCADWLDNTLEELQNFTDRPITIRDKPQPGETAVPLQTALKNAHALVTHSSNVAIEAACLGTPVFVNPASAAASVGLTDLSQIEKPMYPDREPWLAHLAYNQFSYDEVRGGEAWRLLLELEERELA